MARKTFLIFWLLSLIPIILMGSGFYLYARSMSGANLSILLNAVLIGGILSAVVLGVVYWLVTARLFKPLQQLTHTAQSLAQKRSVKTSYTQAAATIEKGASRNEVVSLAKSLDQITDNLQEMENHIQFRAASYQDSLLALTQYAANAASAAQAATSVSRSDVPEAGLRSQPAQVNQKLLIRQALEIAVKHLGYAYTTFFEYDAGNSTPNQDSTGSSSAALLLRQAVATAANQAAAPYTAALPFTADEQQRKILQKALDTSQVQVVTRPDQDSAAHNAVLTEIAIPITSAGQILGVMLGGYRSLQSGELHTAPSYSPVPSTVAVPLAELQILATLTGLANAAAQAGTEHPAGTDHIKADRLAETSALESTLGESAGELSAATIHRRLAEFETLWKISRAISVETELLPLYRLIHDQLTQIMGELSSFAIVLYEQAGDQVHIPYMVEDGKMVSVPAFPLGQGLSSIVIRSGQPLLLAYSSAEKARELGAIFVGEPAKSWLGVPLILGGETFGVIIVQDTHNEGRFDEEDQRLLSLVAAQVAVVVRNARLIEDTRRQASSQSQIIEISDKIRRSAEMQTILKTTADELAVALNARRVTARLFTGNIGDDRAVSDDNDEGVNLTTVHPPEAEG